MAVLWPREMPAEIRRNELRSAECRVYDKLREVLDDNFHVYYSRPWLGLRPDGSEIDGEADFIVAHPKMGMLAIEVKGGGVSYDPALDRWISRDRHGLHHRIKNPVGQARAAKHQILSKLKKSRLWKSRRIVARHGVILPDSVPPDRDLGADMPASLFCCLRDFEGGLRGWILGRLASQEDNPAEGELGADGVIALEDLLAHPFQLQTPLGHIAAGDDRELQLLTTQQFHILTSLSAVKRAAVAGGAGTGKTVLAVEKALRCAVAGCRTLLTCYNAPLAQELARKLHGNFNLDVMSFHALCLRAASSLGANATDREDKRSFYNDELPELLMSAAESGMLPRYDAIIVDEGQDFQIHWWAALEAVLDPIGVGNLYVFYDNNQRVYQQGRNLPEDLQLIPIRLTFNLRNTRSIHDAASVHYSGAPVESNGPNGLPVEWMACHSSVFKSFLEERLSTLLDSEGIAPQDIAVLFATEDEMRQFLGNGLDGKFSYSRCDSRAAGKLIADTVRRFKGLENLVVLVVATPSLVKDRELRYIALSRPRAYLVVMGPEAALDLLRDCGEEVRAQESAVAILDEGDASP